MLTLKPNGDIITGEQAVTYDEKLRAHRVIIDLPRTGEYAMTFEVERLKRADGTLISSEPATPVARTFSQVAAETQTLVDPVTGQTITISVAGIATAIQIGFTRWLFNDNGEAP